MAVRPRHNMLSKRSKNNQLDNEMNMFMVLYLLYFLCRSERVLIHWKFSVHLYNYLYIVDWKQPPQYTYITKSQVLDFWVAQPNIGQCKCSEIISGYYLGFWHWIGIIVTQIGKWVFSGIVLGFRILCLTCCLSRGTCAVAELLIRSNMKLTQEGEVK